MGFPVGGTGVGGSPVPPGIYESQTSAFNETMKNMIGMLPFDTSVIVPFTQQDFEGVFHYRSEPGRPMLHPLLFFRTSSEMEVLEEDKFEAIYHELLRRLPSEMSEWLSDQMQLPFHERDPDALALYRTLAVTADAIGWLANVTQPVQANSPAAANLLTNIALPYAALKGALDQSGFVAQQALGLIYEAGPNYPQHDHFMGALSDIQGAMIEALALQREIEKGLTAEDVKQRVSESANLLHEIADRIRASEETKDLFILSVQIDALATSLAALSNVNGTPALILGSTAALLGINHVASGLGPFGPGFESLMDGVIDGILNRFEFGPRGEIEELFSLQQDLMAWKSSQQE